ncbi:MAG: bifunctional DNA-formamidopyrimidine glycosylase/DNA-(apurinic or apyrimidinic site) lyase [Chromatiaceae bacterium]|nr:bifunctional DNA-formamidopyrimidine glycosylase/DNA-(apurinic or apyrimidinic site) lyase [Chromatiaceae bacterium]MCP5422174.1 bifunctional DNA-formamidopyrimidine glycosylase/DNA-(apurinic or apyrimidinic site) lyase [Chromatiaceae bacterium]
MPELPEVETTRRGIAPHIEGRIVTGAIVRQARLRWPVPDLARTLSGHRVRSVDRRAKYLLLRFGHGTLIVHLGMSGSLRVLPATSPPRTHDHVDLVFGGACLRLHDPRRFGAILWTAGDPLDHPRLRDLGPEPLSEAFDGAYLHACARGRRVAIKSLLMDGHVVVGVGNIYATEALFHAGIHPARASHRVSARRLARLTDESKRVLGNAIRRGGTTLRDFLNESGEPGYFAQELFVYGRAGLSCRICGSTIVARQIGQRTSAYCPHCQH